MKKVKYVREVRFTDVILFVFFIIAVVQLFVSLEYIIAFFHAKKNICEVLDTLAIGYIGSYILYMLTSFVKEYRTRKNINLKIRNNIHRINTKFITIVFTQLEQNSIYSELKELRSVYDSIIYSDWLKPLDIKIINHPEKVNFIGACNLFVNKLYRLLKELDELYGEELESEIKEMIEKFRDVVKQCFIQEPIFLNYDYKKDFEYKFFRITLILYFLSNVNSDKSSYVSINNMIDNILLSNVIKNKYIEQLIDNFSKEYIRGLTPISL